MQNIYHFRAVILSLNGNNGSLNHFQFGKLASHWKLLLCLIL